MFYDSIQSTQFLAIKINFSRSCIFTRINIYIFINIRNILKQKYLWRCIEIPVIWEGLRFYWEPEFIGRHSIPFYEYDHNINSYSNIRRVCTVSLQTELIKNIIQFAPVFLKYISDWIKYQRRVQEK